MCMCPVLGLWQCHPASGQLVCPWTSCPSVRTPAAPEGRGCRQQGWTDILCTTQPRAQRSSTASRRLPGGSGQLFQEAVPGGADSSCLNLRDSYFIIMLKQDIWQAQRETDCRAEVEGGRTMHPPASQAGKESGWGWARWVLTSPRSLLVLHIA